MGAERERHFFRLEQGPPRCRVNRNRKIEPIGYEVTAKASSLEALETFRNNPDEFDLVITDMTMPNMTGKDLAKELMVMRPDIPIILCTGLSERISETTVRGMGIKAFVMKPIIMREMANTIRQVLDEK